MYISEQHYQPGNAGNKKGKNIDDSCRYGNRGQYYNQPHTGGKFVLTRKLLHPLVEEVVRNRNKCNEDDKDNSGKHKEETPVFCDDLRARG